MKKNNRLNKFLEQNEAQEPDPKQAGATESRKKENFTVRIDPELSDKIRALAYWRRQTISELVGDVFFKIDKENEIKQRPERERAKTKNRTPKY